MANETVGRAAAAPRKPKLTWLKIESFRNVAPCTLRFGDGFNVLLGLNATGKTTLLELIAATLSFDFSKFKEEAFAIEYELAFSGGTIVASVRSEREEAPPVEGTVRPPGMNGIGRGGLNGIGRGGMGAMLGMSAELQIRTALSPNAWTVRANMTSVWLEDEKPVVFPLLVQLGERGSYLLSWAADLTTDEPIKRAYGEELWTWESARRFDEALDVFRGITGPGTSVEARVHPSTGAALGFNVAGVVPQDLLLAIGKQVVSMPNGSQGLTIPAESLGFLREVGALFGFKTSRLEMRLEGKVGSQIGGMHKFGEFRFMFEDHDGSVIRHEDLSYGQKRLLAFYYYLAASPTTVIADEIVDGLHHLWIDAAITAIGDRQAFLASQNPLLLDHLEFASVEDVASTFITCRAERTGDDKHMIWSNLSPYDADRFFRAYQVDVQHVSEILLSKGLW